MTFKDQVGALLHERSRPDLIGQNGTNGEWYSFECKGRSAPPTTDDKDNAKGQALRIALVDGQRPALHIAAFTFLRNDELEFYWRDPEPQGEPVRISGTDGAWRWHYEPVTMLWKAALPTGDAAAGDVEIRRVGELDLSIAIHPKLSSLLERGEWSAAHMIARELAAEFRELGYEPDGVALRTGDSWTLPFRSDEQSFG